MTIKIFFLAAAVVLLAGCPIKRPNDVRVGEEKKVVQEVVKTIEMPKNMRFLQYVQGTPAVHTRYIFEEDRPGSGKPPRIVFMERENDQWKRVAHLE